MSTVTSGAGGVGLVGLPAGTGASISPSVGGAFATTIGGGGTAGADAPTEINISGGVMQFEGNDYIRKDQLPSIVAQASKAGEARTMRRLQMSPSSRRRVGL